MPELGSAAETEFLAAAVSDLEKYKRLGEKVFEQLDDEDFFFKPDAESNSIYIIVKHLAGNMRSRWTDFLTADGEKPDRHRDAEFIEDEVGRDAILATWEEGWRHVFEALGGLTEGDLVRTVYIRNQPHSVLQAIIRQTTHYAYHVGQIVYLGKHLKKEKWISLSIPRGKSAEYLSR